MSHVPVGFNRPCGAFEPQLVHAVGQISILGPKSGFHLYNSGPDSPPQVLGDERTELTPS
jgi:hypothetical protein